MNAQAKFENLDDMINEAEETLKKSMGSLAEWGEQARELLKEKPSVILAAAGVSGFVAGAILRHGLAMRRSVRTGRMESSGILPELSRQNLPIDPMILLAGGLMAGLLAGPLLVEKALSGLGKLNRGDEDDILNFENSRFRPTGSMNEKPFEKS